MSDISHNPLPFDLPTIQSILQERLPASEASLRAAYMVEDMPKLGCDLRLYWMSLDTRDRWYFYQFGSSKFGADLQSGWNSESQKAIGYGLNWGDLYTLSKVIRLARHVWGPEWATYKQFRIRQATFDDHLAMVEELWWLGLWHSPTNVQIEPHPFDACNSPVDWQFESCTQSINLEVKYRPRDWIRSIDGDLYFDPPNYPSDYFSDVSKKFPRKNANQFNLLAITLIGPATRDFCEGAASFLETHPYIDGLVFWSFGENHLEKPQCQLQAGAKGVKMLLKLIEQEDRFRNPFILHPWIDREKRRAKHLGLEEDFAKIDGVFYKVGRIFVPKSQRPN